MRTIIGSIFIATYILAMVRPAVPYFDYLLNKSYIANNLCVNKDKPDSDCQGKCHLVKELKKVNNQEPGPNQGNSPRLELEKYPLAILSMVVVELVSGCKKSNLYKHYSFSVKSALTECFTPPPQAIS